MHKALSVRQPWAWLIINAGKDIENRVWPISYRGQILIHAGCAMSHADYDYVAEFLDDRGLDIVLPPFADLERGGIIGSVDITNCVRYSESPWFIGPIGWEMENPTPLTFTPFKGMLGLFNVPRCLIGGCHV